MNPNDELHRNRLSKAVQSSYRGLEWLRNLTRGLVEGYAGSGYGKPGRARNEIVINLMNQTVDAYTMVLVANRPRVLGSSAKPERTFFAAKYTLALNRLIEEIQLENVMKKWVLDGFFGLGIVKVHMADAGLVEMGPGMRVDPGKPWASNVGIDNWVHDLSATRWEHVQYAGDSYRIPFEDLQQPQYFPDVVADLVPDSKQGLDGDRLDQVSRGDLVDDDELEPMIDLCDIWIPRQGMIYTFPMTRRGQFTISNKPVAEMPWDGPEHGPYHLLGFNDVPENIIPTSMAAQLYGLFRLINGIMRKQSRQAMRQKDIHTYSAAGVDDATRLQKANDGDYAKVNDVSQIGLVKTPGADALNQAFLSGLLPMYDRMAGNLTAMMGLGSPAPTPTPEPKIAGKGSGKEAAMQYKVLDAASKLIRDLGWMLWNDKAKVMPARLPIQGADGYSVDATWHPDDREGSFFDYDIQLDVFSMAYQSPAQRWSTISQFVTQIYAPLAQQFAAQGGQLNLQKFTALGAELLNTPQLAECVQFTSALPQPSEEEDGGPPTATTRSYVRKSGSDGPTPQNQAVMDQDKWLNMASDQTGAMRGDAA